VGPWQIGHAAATVAGLVLTALDPQGRRAARAFQSAFGTGRLRSLAMAVSWSAARPREFAAQQRILDGKIRPEAVALNHINDSHVRKWLAEGRSFILAMAHFERNDVFFAPLNERSITHSMEYLVARPPQEHEVNTPLMRRIALQYHQLLRAVTTYRPSLDITNVGENVGVPVSAVKRLRAGGHVVGIMVDSPWAAGSASAHQRPFAGAARSTFATGVGALARIAQCPVVLCLTERQRDGGVLLKWSDPIEAPGRDDREAERRVVDNLLDLVEREIGRRPTRYLWPLGADRRWDPATGSWSNVKSNVRTN
jgi:lauroyl/myristoyl acyltransferase